MPVAACAGARGRIRGWSSRRRRRAIASSASGASGARPRFVWSDDARGVDDARAATAASAAATVSSVCASSHAIAADSDSGSPSPPATRRARSAVGRASRRGRDGLAGRAPRRPRPAPAVAAVDRSDGITADGHHARLRVEGRQDTIRFARCRSHDRVLPTSLSTGRSSVSGPTPICPNSRPTRSSPHSIPNCAGALRRARTARSPSRSSFREFDGLSYSRAVDLARASDEYIETTTDGVRRHRARFFPAIGRAACATSTCSSQARRDSTS